MKPTTSNKRGTFNKGNNNRGIAKPKYKNL